MMDARDKEYMARSKGDLQRSIQIPVHITVNGTDQKIRTTDFTITLEESQILFQNGVNAATEFCNAGTLIHGNRNIGFLRKIKPTDELCRFYFNDGDDVRARLL